MCVCMSFVFTDRHQNIVTNSNTLTCLVQHMSNMLARQLTQPSAHLPLKGLSPQQQSQVLSQYNHDQQRAPAPMQPMVHRLPTCLHNSLSVPLQLLLLLEWMAGCTHCLLLAHACGMALVCLFMHAGMHLPAVCCLHLHVAMCLYACVPGVLPMPVPAWMPFAWCQLLNKLDRKPTDQVMRSGPWPRCLPA